MMKAGDVFAVQDRPGGGWTFERWGENGRKISDLIVYAGDDHGLVQSYLRLFNGSAQSGTPPKTTERAQ